MPFFPPGNANCGKATILPSPVEGWDMATDKGNYQHDDSDDAKDKDLQMGGKHKDFDCPSCNANNPSDDVISDGDELLCNYCGTEWTVKITDDGRLKLREA
jgi:hypothetical protein